MEVVVSVGEETVQGLLARGPRRTASPGVAVPDAAQKGLFRAAFRDTILYHSKRTMQIDSIQKKALDQREDDTHHEQEDGLHLIH